MDYYNQGVRTARRMFDTFICLAQVKYPRSEGSRLVHQRKSFYILWALQRLNEWVHTHLNNPQLHPSWKLGVLAEVAHHRHANCNQERFIP